MKPPRVLIVGAGVAGCACAYYLSLEGAEVTVVDRSGIAAEATGASTGFVDWASGLSRGTLDFVHESIQLLKAAARDLDDFGLALDGYLMLALDTDDLSDLQRRHDRARAAGLETQLLLAETVRAFEPALSSAVIGGLYLPDSGHVDPRRMASALAGGAVRRGARFEMGVEIERLEAKNVEVLGAASADRTYRADHVILAAGAWSPTLAESVGVSLPVVPAKGQMLSTEPLPAITSRVLNSSGAGVRQDRRGVVYVGSTLEYVGFDKEVQPDVISALFADAVRIVPRLREARIADSWAGLRPMTPDTMPVIGETPGISGLWLATGHSRTGLSYAAGTGRAIADLICRGRTALPLGRFDVKRFKQQSPMGHCPG